MRLATMRTVAVLSMNVRTLRSRYLRIGTGLRQEIPNSAARRISSVFALTPSLA